MKNHNFKTEIVTNQKNPIFIKNSEKEGVDISLIITTLIAIISTMIVIWDRIKRPKVNAKILSFAFSPKAKYSGKYMNQEDFTLKGQQYFVKLSIQVIQKILFFNDVKIKVKYANDNNIYNGKICWANPIEWTFKDNKKFNLIIPSNDFLWFNNSLPTDIVSFQYLFFMVEIDKMNMIEELYIEFITTSKFRKKIKIKKLMISEIDPLKMLFDKNIWNEIKS